jgi:hypothetical protein
LNLNLVAPNADSDGWSGVYLGWLGREQGSQQGVRRAGVSSQPGVGFVWVLNLRSDPGWKLLMGVSVARIILVPGLREAVGARCEEA